MDEHKKIAAVGEVLWDVIDGTRHLGGAPANFLSNMARMSFAPFLFSRVGGDADGRALVLELKTRKIDVSCVQLDIFKPTATVNIDLDENGNPSYHCTENVAFDDMRIDATWEEAAPQMDVLFFGMLAQRAEASHEAIQRLLAKAPNALKVFDANIRQWNEANNRIVTQSLKAADIVKLNRDEIAVLKLGMHGPASNAEFLQRLVHDYDLKMAALTLGEVGCYLATPDEQEFDPGYYIAVVDATGAGDAFAAGMTIKYLQGANLKEIADFANRLAAFVSTRRGAAPAWTLEELDQEMELRL